MKRHALYSDKTRMHGTTIVAVHKGGVTAIAGDGQVTLGDTIVKKGSVKVRSLMDGRVITGFAGAVSDAFTLLEKFEGYLTSHRGNLTKAAVETVKEWRTDKMLRNLEAMLIVADAEQILTLSGAGDIIAPDEPVAAVGSGGPYAQAAATALLRHSDMNAADIAEIALLIAADIDIYTSGTATVLCVPDTQDDQDSESDEDVIESSANAPDVDKANSSEANPEKYEPETSETDVKRKNEDKNKDAR